jgi:hypothetical protein
MSNIQIYLNNNKKLCLAIRYNDKVYHTLPISWEYVKLIKGWNNL